MLPRDTVIDAYRLILGRPPEDEDAIRFHQQRESIEDLRQALMLSEEFDRYYKHLTSKTAILPAENVLPPMAEIELTDDPEVLRALFARTAETWRRLGEARPHHSVMGVDRYLPETYAENAERFASTGAADMALVEAALARLAPGERERIVSGLCLEIGCGVGRVTVPLAERFARVHGVDVSEPHLALCRETMARAGAGNVTLELLERVEDYAALPEADFLLSRFVLHHNVPPVQAAMLRDGLARLKPGGAALIQLVTHIDNYAFNAEAYLADPRHEQETHAFPQPALFEIFARSDVSVLETQRDDTAANEPWLRSFVYVLRRRGETGC